MENRKRNVQIIIRVTEEEWVLIEEKILIDGYIITLDLQEVKGHTAQLQKIGVNINQIARRVNSTGSVYQEDIDELKGALDEIWRLQRLSLLKAL